MKHDDKFEDIIDKKRDEAVKTGYMNFNMHFSLYKQEIIGKIESNNVNEMEMSMLNIKQDSENNLNTLQSIKNNDQDKSIVKMMVKEY